MLAPLLLREDSPAAHADRILQKPPDIATCSQSAGRWVNCAPPHHPQPQAPAQLEGLPLLEQLWDWQLLLSAVSLPCSRDCRGTLNLHLPQGITKFRGRALGQLWSLSSGLGSVYCGSQCLQWLWTLWKDHGEERVTLSRYNDMSHWMTVAVLSQTVWSRGLPGSNSLAMVPFGWEEAWSGLPGIYSGVDLLCGQMSHLGSLSSVISSWLPCTGEGQKCNKMLLEQDG